MKLRKNSGSKKREKSCDLFRFLGIAINGTDRVFAFGEDSHALRLASELADLRAVNADRRICCANARRSLSITPKQGASVRMPLVLAGMAGFGPTNVGVKVLCLTAWRHPNNIAIITHKTRYVNEKSLKSARISKKPFLMLKLNQKKP